MGLIIETSAVIAWERALSAAHEIDLDPAEELVMPAIVWAEALAAVARCLGCGVLAGPEAAARFRGVKGLEVKVPGA